MSWKQVRYFFVVFLMVTGFYLAPMKRRVSLPVRGETQQSIADTNGPEFNVPLGNVSIDVHPKDAPLNISLTLRVEVTDPDGVDTVIGSYRMNEETEWENKTLSYTPTEEYPNLYSAFVMNYTVGALEWYFRFYANDTLGNWNSSLVYVHSIFAGYGSHPAQPIFLNPLFWIALVATVLVLVIIVREISKNR